MTRVAEREVIIHEQITRGAEGMTSAYDSWWLRFMSGQFESEITIHQGERWAGVRSPLKFMGAFESTLLAGERVTGRAEGEDAERAVGFVVGVISGVGLTPEGGHTRVSNVNVKGGSHKGAGSNTPLYTRVQGRGRSPRLLYRQTCLPDSPGAWRLGQRSENLG